MDNINQTKPKMKIKVTTTTEIEATIPCYRQSASTQYYVYSETNCILVRDGYHLDLQQIHSEVAFATYTTESTKEEFETLFNQVLTKLTTICKN